MVFGGSHRALTVPISEISKCDPNRLTQVTFSLLREGHQASYNTAVRAHSTPWVEIALELKAFQRKGWMMSIMKGSLPTNVPSGKSGSVDITQGGLALTLQVNMWNCSEK